MKKKTRGLIFFTIAYIIFSMVLIRGNMLINRGYEMNPKIIEDSALSLIKNPLALPRFEDLKLSLIITAFIGLYIVHRNTDKKKYRDKEEYGSAEWGKFSELKDLTKKDEDRNIILSENVKIALDDSGREKRNNNIMVIGGSGTGKSRFMVKPNICQLHSSYVITDPKGEMLEDTGKIFKENDYKIKVLDLYNMESSYRYNPFDYIEDEEDILNLIENFINNTQDKSQKSNDPFWEKSEKALLQSLMAFVHLFLEKEDRNFSTLLRLLERIEVKENGEKNQMDFIMEEYNEKYPQNFAYRQYQIFKQSSGKTAQSILVSTAVRLSPFNIRAVEKLTSEDEMDIDSLAKEKTVIFILIPDTNKTFNFIVAMFLEQLFQRLYYINDFIKPLKHPVRLMLDEFANIGQINEFEQKLATMRSRKISATMIIQDISQIENLYRRSWKSLIGNSDSLLYLGSNEKSTNEYVSKLLGKETIDIQTQNKNRGRNKSFGTNYQRVGRELLNSSEIGQLDNKECISIIRGLNPFLDDKYDIKGHERYKYLHDDPKDNNKYAYTDYRKNLKENIENETKEKESLDATKQSLNDSYNLEDTKEIEDLLNNHKEEIIKNIEETKKLEEELSKEDEGLAVNI